MNITRFITLMAPKTRNSRYWLCEECGDLNRRPKEPIPDHLTCMHCGMVWRLVPPLELKWPIYERSHFTRVGLLLAS